MVYICPKCGKEDIAEANSTLCCKNCSTLLIQTESNTYNDALAIKDGTIDIIERRRFEKYVKDNPLYDPDEAELYQARRKRAREIQEAETAQRKAIEAAKPKCPSCGSANIDRIGAIKKGVSIGVFGIFSSNIGKNMYCKDCGNKW